MLHRSFVRFIHGAAGGRYNKAVSSSAHESSQQVIKEIFLGVCELPLDEREEQIQQRCGRDAGLMSAVRTLLDAHDRAGNFLAGPTFVQSRSSPVDLLERKLPERIGQYKLLQAIGEGGFGTVYMAEQEHPVRRRVALKVIKLGMDSRAVIARFEAERQALAMMDHPGIAKVFDAGTTDSGRPYFVMELVKGIPITEYCDLQKLSIEQRLELFAEVCHAVQHAHQKGVIQRDIKPCNVLICAQDDQPHVKIIDFGIAKATQARLTERTLFTEFRQLIGTPEYMSPEQASGSLDIDTRTDVYALGVLLYELLTGTTPFDGHELRSKAYDEMQRVIRDVDPPKPSTRLSTMRGELAAVAAARHVEPRRLNSTVRGELDWIVMKAIDKDRTRRYETANGLAADVMRYLADEPVSARPPTTAYLLRKFVRRNRVPVIASAAVLLALVAGIVGTTIGLIGQARQRAEAERQSAFAGAVSQFQADMLASADPQRLLGDKVTVVQTVLAAVRELDAGKLKDQPLVEANVRYIIGNTLRALGRYDDAEPNLRQAVELRRKWLHRGHQDTAESLRCLAVLLMDMGRAKEAEPLAREALSFRRAALPAAHPHITQCMDELAALLQAQGRFAEAESLLRDVLRLRQENSTPEDLDLATTLNNLGQCLQAQGRLAEAEPVLRKTLEIIRKARPPGHPTIGTTVNNLALLLMAERQFVEAEPLFREALEIRRGALPAGHPDIAGGLNNLAGALKNQGKLAEAEPLWREALEINRKALPAGHPHTASTINNLARLLEAEGKLDQAEPLFRESLDMRRKALPTGHPEIAQSLSNLGWLLRAQGRLAEAEPLFRESLTLYEAKFGPDHPQVGISRLGLGRVLAGLDRPMEAETTLLEAERVLATARAVPPGLHNECVIDLVNLYLACDRSQPGKGYDVKARQWQERLPAPHPATTQASAR